MRRTSFLSAALLLCLFGQCCVAVICNATDPGDSPQTTGCEYCVLGTNEGCQNNGICFPHPTFNISVCSCKYGWTGFQCTIEAPPLRLCNASNPLDSPLAGAQCELCRLSGPDRNQGCQNGGQCYIYDVPVGPGIPPGYQIPLCGCTYEWAPPTCATPSVLPPLCEDSPPGSRPPTCEYCRLDDSAGCKNGGTCYLRNFTGPEYPPLFQTPICGCFYEWDPPTCAAERADRPLCTPNSTLSPPDCDYCLPGVQYPNPNGCSNIGSCSVQSVVGPGFPPNFEIPLCSCQIGWVPPTCSDSLYNTTREGFGDNTYAYSMRFIYVAMMAVIGGIAILLIVEHVVKGPSPMSSPAKHNVFGLVMVAISAFLLMLYLAVNQNGLVWGYNNYATLWFQQFFLNGSVAAAAVAIWVVTGVWISISVTTIRNRKGWPKARVGITIGVVAAVFGVAIILSSYQAYNPDGRWMFLVAAVLVVFMLAFCIVSALVIIKRVARSSISNSKQRMRRLAVQLVVVSIICVLAIVILLILVFLPSTIFDAFFKYYFLEVFFPIVVEAIFLVALLFFFRLSDWKTKVAKGSRTQGGSSSARQSELFQPGDISALEEGVSESASVAPTEGTDGTSDTVAAGVITL